MKIKRRMGTDKIWDYDYESLRKYRKDKFLSLPLASLVFVETWYNAYYRYRYKWFRKETDS